MFEKTKINEKEAGMTHLKKIVLVQKVKLKNILGRSDAENSAQKLKNHLLSLVVHFFENNKNHEIKFQSKETKAFRQAEMGIGERQRKRQEEIWTHLDDSTYKESI